MGAEKNQTTNFAKVIKALKVSGTELSEILHIDSSLISKWRTNKRKFKASSPIFEELVIYLMTLDSANDYKRIKSLLANQFSDVEEAGEDRLKLYLKKWLIEAVSEEDSEPSILDYIGKANHLNPVTAYPFYGNQGKREAINAILQYGIAMAEEEEPEVYAYMQDEQSWFSEEPLYVDEWEKLNRTFLEKGGRISVVHPISRRDEQLAFSLLAWLPLYLTGRVNAYFLSTSDPLRLSKSIVILKDHVLFTQTTTGNKTDQDISLVTEDKAYIANVAACLSAAFRIASPCLTAYYRHDGGKYMAYLSHIVNLDESQYLFMKWPFVNITPVAEMREILNENHIDSSRIDEILEACQKLKTDLRRDTDHHFRYLLPKDSVVGLLRQKRICLDTVSLFCGQQIYITNDRFRKMVQRLADVLEHANTHTKIKEIALLNEVNARAMRYLNVMVKNNTCVSIFNDSRMFIDDVPWVLTSTEMPMIRSLYSACHELWETTFPQNKDRHAVSRQLLIWLNTIPVSDDE